MPGPDYIVDIKSLRPPGAETGADEAKSADPKSLKGRPWLAVHWRCCSVYSRIYRNVAGTTYEGRCPRCGKPVRVNVAPGGTSHRFFEAG